MDGVRRSGTTKCRPPQSYVSVLCKMQVDRSQSWEAWVVIIRPGGKRGRLGDEWFGSGNLDLPVRRTTCAEVRRHWVLDGCAWKYLPSSALLLPLLRTPDAQEQLKPASWCIGIISYVDTTGRNQEHRVWYQGVNNKTGVQINPRIIRATRRW